MLSIATVTPAARSAASLATWTAAPSIARSAPSIFNQLLPTSADVSAARPVAWTATLSVARSVTGSAALSAILSDVAQSRGLLLGPMLGLLLDPLFLSAIWSAARS